MNLKLMSIESRRKDKDFENFVGLQLGGGYRDKGPPSEVVEVATFLHACEGDAVTKLCQEKIPYLNAPIYLQHKTQIGKVDEIFGPINESYRSYLIR
ncbi:putative H/ACA ribonucleoprotein complex subunit 1-like protein 1 isoform X3 [Brassica napus]|uniref:putative H/ACA ribonucleoprotein complex subunit 1-like protein 1 isoform X3 n=1 Tax=Brassica napus TaxID=3708 RepID=UPI002078B42A|nr:putative H/ACA ribonucleoprotein complex subunit 1-like protein 1 isoform X3 [Brassica napus]